MVEIADSLANDLYDNVEKKWQYSLNTEIQIRETTLAQMMPELDREKMKKEIKKHVGKFSHKYRVFSILWNNKEDVVQKTTQFWKSLCGLTTPKTIGR